MNANIPSTSLVYHNMYLRQSLRNTITHHHITSLNLVDTVISLLSTSHRIPMSGGGGGPPARYITHIHDSNPYLPPHPTPTPLISHTHSLLTIPRYILAVDRYTPPPYPHGGTKKSNIKMPSTNARSISQKIQLHNFGK